jgi:Asp-tRNA(Asn)/Glu-tRNA(Gln) amidotransferase C subunit
MTRAERNELLSAAVGKLEEASKLLMTAEEELLADQANELADFVDVLTAVHEEAA